MIAEKRELCFSFLYTRLSAGLELAQAMAVFGAQVTVIERGNHIMGREDSDAAAIVHRQMEKDGVHFMLSTTIEEFSPNTDGKVAARVVQNGIKVGWTTAVTVMYDLPVCQHCACMFTVVSTQGCNVVNVVCM